MNERISKPKARPLVDQRSFDLSEHFLQDTPHTEDHVWALAGEIQKAVEDWFEYREMLAASRLEFKGALKKLGAEADQRDAMIMLWAQRNPRVCASNSPTGEHINYGGRRQP